MSRTFVGSGYEAPVRYGVHVERDGVRYGLTQRVRGSEVDFKWDGGGPGSTDLARALLWEVTGVEPEWRLYRHFKNDVVATWPQCVGECWRIGENEVKRWLAEVERNTARAEDAGQTEARLEQERAREQRLSSFARTFGRRK